MSQYCKVITGDLFCKTKRDHCKEKYCVVSPSTDPNALDASPCDLLTVVELNALQPMAAFQVLQSHVGYKGAVIQFHHGEALLATSTAAQGSNAIICDQLTV